MIGALRHAYLSLGVSSDTAMLLLLGSLIGSYFNIPIAELPPEQVVSDQVIEFFGMEYTVPIVESLAGHGDRRQCRRRRHPDDHVALSAHHAGACGCKATDRHRDRRGRAALARRSGAGGRHRGTDVRAGLDHRRGSLVLSRENAAPLAYMAGSLGTLIGADLTNLDKVRGLGAPVASIGGAGTFDGIFLTGILAVLLAGLYHPRRQTVQAQ